MARRAPKAFREFMLDGHPELQDELRRNTEAAFSEYQASAEYKALREETRQLWSQAGIDIDQVEQSIRVDMLAAHASPEFLLAWGFDREHIENTDPSEWFRPLMASAVRKQLELYGKNHPQIPDKTPVVPRVPVRGVSLLSAVKAVILAQTERGTPEQRTQTQIKDAWKKATDPPFPQKIGGAANHKSKDLFEADAVISFVESHEGNNTATIFRKHVKAFLEPLRMENEVGKKPGKPGKKSGDRKSKPPQKTRRE